IPTPVRLRLNFGGHARPRSSKESSLRSLESPASTESRSDAFIRLGTIFRLHFLRVPVDALAHAQGNVTQQQRSVELAQTKRVLQSTVDFVHWQAADHFTDC